MAEQRGILTYRRMRLINRPKKGLTKWLSDNMWHLCIITILLNIANSTFFPNPDQVQLRVTITLIIVVFQLIVGYIAFSEILMIFTRPRRRRKQIIHQEASDLTGKTCRIKKSVELVGDTEITIIDWLDRLSKGKSWVDIPVTNDIVALYACRKEGVELDDPKLNEVLYGIVGEHTPLIVHIDEIELNESAGAIQGQGAS